MTIRRANERGHGAHDWRDMYHTFSFADLPQPGMDGMPQPARH